MNKVDIQYQVLLQELVDLHDNSATVNADRTGVGTYSLFHRSLRFNLQEGFPILTTKFVSLKSVLGELLWLLSGNCNSQVLEEKYGCTIWREWGDTNGNLGAMYGHEWRNFGGEPENFPQPTPRLPEGFKPNILGVACCDLIISKEDELTRKVYNTWRGMIARCYVKTKDTYKYYGGKGVYVSNDWLIFSKFFSDIKKLPNWSSKLENWELYQLDKDTIGSGFEYSFESCTWLTKDENQRATYRKRHFFLHEDGEKAVVDNPIDFYTQHKIAQGNFCSMLRGDRKSSGGWKLVKTIDKTAGFDQIRWLINEIKTNPTSRRLYVTAANPNDRYKQALDCCHNYFQVVIHDGKLNLYFQMRSSDVFLGLPYNIASYAALAHMLALETGYEVGELVYSGVDVHLYTNHIEQAKLQLSREPKALPKLVINKKPFFEYELSDFKLEGYEYHPAIKADVAV